MNRIISIPPVDTYNNHWLKRTIQFYVVSHIEHMFQVRNSFSFLSVAKGFIIGGVVVTKFRVAASRNSTWAYRVHHILIAVKNTIYVPKKKGIYRKIRNLVSIKFIKYNAYQAAILKVLFDRFQITNSEILNENIVIFQSSLPCGNNLIYSPMI